ncbi:MAG: hypothetical protein RXO36_07415 [Candidatus Nanopusillus acidilobi]
MAKVYSNILKVSVSSGTPIPPLTPRKIFLRGQPTASPGETITIYAILQPSATKYKTYLNAITMNQTFQATTDSFWGIATFNVTLPANASGDYKFQAYCEVMNISIIYSNTITISVFPGGESSTGLEIKNFTLQPDCSLKQYPHIIACGTLVDKNGPISYVLVDVGLCSDFNFNTKQFITPIHDTVWTVDDGSFCAQLQTNNGQHCVVAKFSYGDVIAIATATIDLEC